MRMRMVASWIAFLPLAACDSYGGGNYRGEPLATIRGVVSGGPTERDLEAALIVGEDPIVGQVYVPIETEGEFPNSFVMNIYEPPPDEYLTTTLWTTRDPVHIPPPAEGEPRHVSSEIAVIVPGGGGPDSGDAETDPANPLALSCETVVYFESDVPADSATGQHFGGEFSAGYHLMRMAELAWFAEPDPTAEQLACYERARETNAMDEEIEDPDAYAAADCRLWYWEPVWAPELPLDTIVEIDMEDWGACNPRFQFLPPDDAGLPLPGE